MKNKIFYSSAEACKLIDVERGRLREWLVQGFLRYVEPFQGQGKTAYFELIDIYYLGIFKSLIEAGFKRSVAGQMMNTFFQPPDYSSTQYIAFIYAKGKTHPIRYENDAVFEILRKNPFDRVHIINFVKIREEIDKRRVPIDREKK